MFSIFQAAFGQVSLLKDCYPGSIGSFARRFLICKDTLFFHASIPNGNSGLFKSDGTPAGTKLTVELPWGFEYPVVFNNKIVYFDAKDGVYITDGTTAGTQKLFTVDNVRPSGFVEYNGKLYFAARTSTSRYETYETDGTVAGTQLFYFPAIGAYDDVRKIVKAGNYLYIQANTYTGGENLLWASDGTNAGSVMIKDMDYMGYYLDMAEYNNKLYFTVSNTQLWSTDGTIAGTKEVKSGLAVGGIRKMFVHNNELYFMGEDIVINNKMDLWKTDGTDAGTIKLTDSLALCESIYGFPTKTLYASVGNKLYFAGEKNGGIVEGKDKGLYVTDGTKAGTKAVKLIPKIEDDPYFVVADTNVYFKANDGQGIQLWKSGGTTASTKALYAPAAIAKYKSPLTNYSDIISYHNEIIYAAQYDSLGLGLEVYKYTFDDTPVKTKVLVLTTENLKASLYPNPVNEVATLEIHLKQAAQLTVSIYNTIGVKVKEVVNKEMAAGDHKIQVDAADMTSGLYYMSIDTGQEQPTIIKMIK
jgi:ELWxxDGT repeat protein